MTESISTAARAPRSVTAFGSVFRTLLRAGLPLGFNGLITIRGRKTGQPHTSAVAIIDVEGRRWVWCPWGDVNWVRNLRVAGEATITVRRQSEVVRARELDPTERLGSSATSSGRSRAGCAAASGSSARSTASTSRTRSQRQTADACSSSRRSPDGLLTWIP